MLDLGAGDVEEGTRRAQGIEIPALRARGIKIPARTGTYLRHDARGCRNWLFALGALKYPLGRGRTSGTMRGGAEIGSLRSGH